MSLKSHLNILPTYTRVNRGNVLVVLYMLKAADEKRIGVEKGRNSTILPQDEAISFGEKNSKNIV